jgi:HSP20 family molecular chaperone IbpA
MNFSKNLNELFTHTTLFDEMYTGVNVLFDTIDTQSTPDYKQGVRTVEMNFAGISKEDIKITETGDHLIVKGDYKLVKDLEDKDIQLYKVRGEYYYPADINILLEKGWKKGLKELNLKPDE